MSATRPLFLLGAGFNVDAAPELGLKESIWVDESLVSAEYPLVSDLRDFCFGLTELPPDQSVEHLFEEAIRTGNQKPIEKLFLKLRYCDYKIPRQLIEGSQQNAYSGFFTRFPECNFLTANYDGLVEIALLALGRWTPSDGYGIKVETRLNWPDTSPSVHRSSALVVHFHGSLYVRTERFTIAPARPGAIAMIEPRDKPEYSFDPHSASGAFRPFGRAKTQGDDEHGERIILPVPDKTTIASQPYVEAARRVAVQLAREADPLVAIGYKFNPYDRDSYDSILQALRGRVLIVAPDSADSAKRVASDYPRLHVEAIPRGFADWVRSSYPGIEC